MIKNPLRLIALGWLGVVVQLSGCAPAQIRDVRVPEEPVMVREPEPSVIVMPYPESNTSVIGAVSRDAAGLQTETSRPSSAVVALIDEADQQSRSGRLDAAAAGLERALRIAPGDPVIWNRLAEVRLQQRQLDQAESLAAKSNSLAGSNRRLLARNWQLIAEVHAQRGDSERAREAMARAQEFRE